MVVAASEDRSNFGKAQVFQNEDLTTVAAQLPNNVWEITSTDYGSRGRGLVGAVDPRGHF